ncbi:class I SAM-dependent methyltransferase [Hwanghaeella grinnelliae]|uniref:class I SAM-dependent methyltransferase n=1 Tax=Hwanghaeella grinnelliae TaxID=2500179 RepID=UPI001F00A9D7|nr:class I SAM-dependent methyltransferase [Hwanghaeella grinnelliae]
MDSFIRRVTAQRACLDYAAQLIDGQDGVVLEVGLGNGRTFDHLREIMPDREIFVFDRQVASHPDSTPDEDHLFLGDLPDTLARAAEDLPQPAILVHSDIGTGNAEWDARMAEMMADVLPRVLKPGAVVVSDQKISLADAEDISLPAGVQKGRYFFQTYRGR